ncbi:succinate dehydrogenase assembly factor 2-B, mitochondrial-like [Battus philenor]|uniref:succinate dehydrogenase assembly factor 2-B, mitochondrial-like n=1 Tax=Battus philenor TaxID=42288 RepID=UPI0035CFD5BA
MLRLRSTCKILQPLKCVANLSDKATHVDTTYMEIPIYDIDKPQSLECRKARLHYQSRKRGMLENDLLLSTFAKKYLNGFNAQQTLMYDRLINSPSNDWDLFYWIVGKQPTPKEFDNEVMDLLKRHAKNEERVTLSQPPLH